MYATLEEIPSWTADVAAFIVGAICCADSVVGQERSSDAKQEPQVKPSENASLDARAMVEALANRNPPPKLSGPFHKPTFDPTFDWPENNRAWKAVLLVIRHAERAWPELVSHLDDQRYCITYETFTGFNHNKTVGEMCRKIIARNLSEAYYQNLRPESKTIYAKMRWPEVARDKKKLKVWCEERRAKKLYELQIEMCEWAIAELNNPDAFPDLSDLRQRAWTAAIEAEIESLREAQRAILYAGFGPEEIMPYTREDAEK